MPDPAEVAEVVETAELPLSFAQERLWFIDRLVPGSAAYNIPLAIELRGRFDRPAWAAAIGHTRRRHEALRTTFAEAEDGVVQRIAPPDPAPWAVPEIDLTGLAGAALRGETDRLVAEEVRRPFDLVRGPLLRAAVLAATPQRAVALLSVHHIVADGWSLALVLGELAALYSGLLEAASGGSGRQPSPAILTEGPLAIPLEIQYGDFAVWQREGLTPAVVAEPLAHFRAALNGAPPVLALPTDRPRPAVQSFRGRHRSVHLTADLVERLGDAGRAGGATLFMTLLAAFAALLHRLSGADAVPIGLPVAGRGRTELEKLVGLFVNTVVVCPLLAPGEPFRRLLAAVREQALAAYAREHLPFERLVEELKAGSSLSHNPIFQVLFAFHVEAMETPCFAGLEGGLLELDLRTARVDLSLAAEPAEDGGLTAALELATDLLDPTTGARMLAQWRELLAGVAAEPAARIGELPLFAAAERHQLVAEWNDVPAFDSPDTAAQAADVLSRWEEVLRRAPEATAIARWQGGGLADGASFAALDRQAERLARALAARGAGPETRVGICLARSPALAAAILGVWKAGAAWVPLDPLLPDARLAFLALDGVGGGSGRARVVVTETALLQRLAGLGVAGLETLALDALDETTPAAAAATAAPRGELAYLIYTSGTTGAPKAVAVEHRSLAWTLGAVAPWFAACDRTPPRMPCLAPFSFDIFLFELLAPLLAGGTAVLFDLQPTLDVAALCAALPSMTHLHAVPALARQVAAALRRRGIAAGARLRRVFVGGDAVPGDLVGELAQAFPAAQVTILYGPTEAAILAAADQKLAILAAGDQKLAILAGDRRGIGRPLPGAELHLCDAFGAPVAIGVAGEIRIGGPGVARGYLGKPDLTAERFVPHQGGGRLYRSGDLARRLADGRIEFLGRVDRQLKVRGFRIEPAEVEAALAAHPAVAAAAVALAETAPGGPRLAAWVVLRPASAASAAALAEHLRARLPAYMIPGDWTAVAELPLTAHGKVDRGALRSAAAVPWPAAGRAAAPYAAPRTPLEERLAAIWAELLGRERAGVHDDFFAAGGHSLLATQALSRLRDALGIELPVAALFESPTPAGLAARIEREAAAAPAAPPITPAPRLGDPPLSFAQERLWLLDQLRPGATYNLPFAIDLAGPLDAGAWAAAVAAVRRRHEALRTRFRAVADEAGRAGAEIASTPSEIAAVQVIDAADSGSLPPTALVDLAALPAARRAAEAERWTAAEARRPFDLGAGPLLRSALLRLDGGERHRALLSFHHIVSDGWSTEVLLGELAAQYAAAVEGRADAALAPLPVQYADYAVWQRRWLAGEALDRQLAYWRRQLHGDLVVELPGDRPRPLHEAPGELAGAQLPAAVRPALADALAACGRSAGATPFMALLAAFAALVGRVAGRIGQAGGGGAGGERIAIGAPIANRNHAETEGLIGFFVNSLVLVADLGREPTFAELLHRVRETALGAYAHQDLPFEKLVAELRPERRLDGNPLFRVALSLNRPLPLLVTRGAGGAPVTGLARETPTGTAKFDLALALSDRAAHGAHGDHGAAGLGGEWEYRTDLFDRTTVARLAAAFGHLLADAVARPDHPVGRLDLLGEAARHQLTREWNDTAASFPRGATLVERFARQVARTPAAVALAGPAVGDEVSYAELDRRALALSRRLAAAGVGIETRVALLLARSVDLVVAILATLRAGGAYVPLDPAYPAARLAFMLDDSGAKALVTHRGLAATAGGLAGAAVATLDLDRAEAAEAAEAGAAAAEVSPLRPPPDLAADNLAYIMYTSGSTGVPKGVAVTHRNVVRLVEGTSYAAFGPEQVFLQLAPASFDASTLEIWGALLHGGRLALAAEGRTTLAELAAAIRDHGVTALWLTAGLFHQMVDEELAALAPLRQLLAGGDALSPPRVRAALARLPGTALVNGYGPTEGTTFSCCERLAAGGSAAVPIGRPIANARAHVLDAHFERTPVGVAGELHLGGDGLARGYLDRPDLTAERFVPDPLSAVPGERLYRTGDRVRLLPDGRLDFLGRTDLQVKIAGQRIEPGEVETALARHPRVRQCAAIVLGAGAEEKRLVAFAVLDDGPPAGAADLRAWLARRLPEAMVPARLLLADRLPLTANGKIDRTELARLAAGSDPGALAGDRGGSGAGTPERNPVVELLAGVWADLLGRERVGLNDSFFDLGGHSLLGTRLIARIRHLFGVELSLRALFEEPTVAGLAALLERGTEGPDLPPLTALAPAARAAGVPASLTQRRLWFLQQLAPDAFFLNVPHAVRLRGDLRAPALSRALSAIAARHQPLRTTFSAAAGEPMQRIAPPAPLPLPLVDLAHLPAARRDAAARRLVRGEAERPFDLTRGPLLRCLLVRLAPADHLLALVPHHLVFDGWSIGVLFRELSALYGAFALGRPSPLAPLPVAYADFADWQRRVLAGPLGERQLAYWRERLADLPALDLPTDHPRPPAPSFRGAFAGRALKAPLAGALAALGRRQGVTLFMVVLAAWETLLAHLSGQRDFPVGAPVAGRNRPEVESLVGFFVNTLVLRADLSREPRFADLLSRARETVLGAYAHQDLPFEELVLALKPERHAAANPIFDVLLSFEEPGMMPALPGLALEPFAFDYDAAHFELMLVVRRAPAAQGGAMALTLNYRRDLFDRTTASRHLGHLEALLAAAAGEPEAPALDLPFWEAGARHQVLHEWAAEGWSAPCLATVDRLARAAARRSPDALAIAGEGGCFTYGGLAAAAAGIARGLRRAGVGRGERVALALDRSPELAAASLAVLSLGAACLAIDPATPEARLAEIVADAGARAIVGRAALVSGLPGRCLPGGSSGRSSALDVEAACRGALLTPSGAAAEPSLAAALDLLGRSAHGADDLAYVIYTSGSTGRPKGVELTHDGFADLLAWHREVYGAPASGRLAWTANPGFDASSWELWASLTAGSSLHAPPLAVARSPRDLLAWMAAEAITFAFLTTPLAEAVVRLPPPPDLALRWLVTGGDRLRQAPVPEARYTFVNHYGPTETTVVSTWEVVPAAGGRGPMPPLGRPLGGALVYLLGRDLAPVPLGGRGEICLGGRCLARGYLGRPELTAERFVPHPFAGAEGVAAGARLYRSGDFGRLLADGRVDFLGRVDRQVKVRGFRVELGEIEAHLTAHPAVREAAILAEESPGGARLVACIVPRSAADAADAELTAGALRAHLRAALPDYMIPALFVAVGALPESPNGKLDRAALARLAARSPSLDGAWRNGGAGAEVLMPSGKIEILLARLWREVLRLPAAMALGAEDNFFDLGGQSLAMVAVHDRLRAELGAELPLVELFEHTTIRGLAARLAGGAAGAPAADDVARRAERQRQAPAWKERARQARRQPAS